MREGNEAIRRVPEMHREVPKRRAAAGCRSATASAVVRAGVRGGGGHGTKALFGALLE